MLEEIAFILFPIAGADPELVVGANPLGVPANIFIHFLKNPMKLKKFWSVGGGGAPGAPPKKNRHCIGSVTETLEQIEKILFLFPMGSFKT